MSTSKDTLFDIIERPRREGDQLATNPGSNTIDTTNGNRFHAVPVSFLWICALAASLFVSACSREVIHAAAPAAVMAADNSFADLVPGQRLRVVVPLLKSGGFRVVTGSAAQSSPGVIELRANDLLGYEMYEFAVQQRARGRVTLALASAVVSKDGKSATDTDPPKLPFRLPENPRHIRLIYFIRNSESDHNMAIAAAAKRDALDVFTARLKTDPDVCPAEGAVSCTWVPPGIAVRPE